MIGVSFSKETKVVDVFNEPYYSLGFGDTINKLSYLFRTYENVHAKFHVHDKKEIYDRFLFLKNFCFEEPEKKKILINTDFFIRGEKDFRLINHTYWPTKIKWEQSGSTIAINFYKKVKRVFLERESQGRKYKKQKDIETCKLFKDSLEIQKRYNTIELYGVEKERGHNRVISSPENCLYENMKILSSCKLFVTSEGGMAHLSRAMCVPTIVYYEKDEYGFYTFLENFIDKKIQKLVHSKDEMIEAIDYYLKNAKFN